MKKKLKKILVTGSAGFIGYSTCLKLLERGDKVIGLDNHNNYYDPNLKKKRVSRLTKYSNYKHIKLDIKNQKKLKEVFENNRFSKVINLAAQAGVRYSMENPLAYIESNIVGFANILESCRRHGVDRSLGISIM